MRAVTFSTSFLPASRVVVTPEKCHGPPTIRGPRSETAGQRGENLGGGLRGGVPEAGASPEIDPVGVARGRGGRPDGAGQVVQGRVAGRGDGAVAGGEQVGQAAGRAAGERTGDDRGRAGRPGGIE